MKDVQEIAPGMANAGQPLEGVATAGQPDQAQFERLAEAGYKTVIDLRTPEEPRGFDEPEIVGRAGMEYANIPIGHEGVDADTFDRFRRIMTDPEQRPVLVHCSSANRVGALLVPYLILDEGRTLEEARDIAARVGLKSEELERAAFRYVERKR
jgi:protein tyrosine phosphatase (PTP) superfamily phosphohydrolase (DUF442 family)